ncbi:MAG: hypothetical protein Q8876_00750 [Bacillota bacterium]|nr:hypothetical protein [Bacillota bacterium]
MQGKKPFNLNLLFSSFLVIGFIVCGYFFSTIANQMKSPANMLIPLAVFVVFGALLFYATRVGEGRQIKRFSLFSLILIVIPTVYIILAALVPNFPLHNQFLKTSTDGTTTLNIIVYLSAIALGYGLPYTFLSGFEMEFDEAEKIEEIADSIESNEESEEISEEEAEAIAADESEAPIAEEAIPEETSVEEETVVTEEAQPEENSDTTEE